MQLIFRTCISSILFLSAVIVLAILVGTTQPVSQRLIDPGLTLCELPCVAGVILGKMSQVEAKMQIVTLLRKITPQTNIQTRAIGWFEVSALQGLNAKTWKIIVNGMTDNNDVLDTMEFSFNPNAAPKMGDIVSLFGVPNCTDIFLDNMATNPIKALIYVNRSKNKDTTIIVSALEFKLNKPVKSLTYTTRGPSGCDDTSAPWYGFTDLK